MYISRTPSVAARCSKWGMSLGLALLLNSCGFGDVKDATRYWHRLGQRSVELTGTFLTAVSSGDSAKVSAIATDSVAARVMNLSRRSAIGALAEAARQFRTSDMSVRVFGNGALVTFPYEFEGHTLTAGVETGFMRERL